MTSRRMRKSAVGMQLFPFLAVLICTMGALIALLVIVVQQATAHASAINRDQARRSAVQVAESAEALQLELEELDWRREELERQRGEKTKDLANQRLELSHLEDHIRRLEQRWADLQRQAAEVDKVGQGQNSDLWASRQQLEQLRAAADQARAELERLRERAAAAPQSFAIIPYEGPQGTRRRPIYIECRQEAVTLHPEGIVLRPRDFEGSLGPGNPLDAALRATREYLARKGDTQIHGEPYPILIVRPDGAVAYAVARAAMKSWEDEFGYELIDAEMPLSFPAPDPELAKLLTKAIEEARQREELLAAAMPSQYGSPSGLVAGGNGGFVLEDELGELAGDFSAGGASSGSPARASRPGGRNPLGSRDPGGLPSPEEDLGLASGPAAASAELAGPSARSTANGPSTAAARDGVPRGAGSLKPTKQRGKDWGLPGSTQGLTGVTRPIRVVCLPDRLVILPERGDRRGRAQETLLTGGMDHAIEDFVAAIWKQVDGWGIAVAGGYWKPELTVEVAPGAEARFDEFQTLMKDSGLAVRRKP